MGGKPLPPTFPVVREMHADHVAFGLEDGTSEKYGGQEWSDAENDVLVNSAREGLRSMAISQRYCRIGMDGHVSCSIKKLSGAFSEKVRVILLEKCVAEWY